MLGTPKRMQATARRLSVVSAMSSARRRLIRSVRPHKMEPLPASTRIELLRSKSQEEVYATSQILTEAGVPHKVTSNSAGFDITSIGRTDFPSDIILTVAHSDYNHARDVMENVYSETTLPEGHFLISASNEDILDILSSPAEWSAFDVAHAKRIGKERGIDTNDIKSKTKERVIRLHNGKSPSHWLLILGWVTACLGGVIGIGIGYSLAYMKDNSPEGEFYTYDEQSRKIGRRMMYFSLFMLVATRLLWILYSDAR